MGRELLIGCGNLRDKRVLTLGKPEWQNLVTLDIDPSCKPDVVWDLNQWPLPFEDNSFSEIHAYDVLEHCGTQGDYKFFFGQFTDFWRLLEPNGVFCGSCPARSGPWVWGDPGHTRYIGQENLNFLNQDEYKRQIGKTKMCDYRHIYRADFILEGHDTWEDSYYFSLRVVKPSRVE